MRFLNFTLRDVRSNSIANLVQALCVAVSTFLVYYILSARLGIEYLGIWSVVVSTTAISRMFDFGLSSSVAVYVARFIGDGQLERAGDVVDTVTIVVGIVFLGLAPLMYLGSQWIIGKVFDGDEFAFALTILPYAVAAFWINSVAIVGQAALDGAQQMVVRASIVISGQVLYLLLIHWMLPLYGLTAVVIAQLVQALFLAMAFRVFVRRYLKLVSIMPRRVRLGVLSTIKVHALNVQVGSLFAMFLDPTTKLLIGYFGGAAGAGYFEIANQISLKARSLLISALQAYMPAMTGLALNRRDEAVSLFLTSQKIMNIAAISMFSAISIWCFPYVALMVPESPDELVFYVFVLGFFWSFNVFTAPTYFWNQGVGRIQINTLSHLSIGVINLALGLLLGSIYGQNGVVIGYGLAIFFGSLLVILLADTEVVTVIRTELSISIRWGILMTSFFLFLFIYTMLPLRIEVLSILAVLHSLLIFKIAFPSILEWFGDKRDYVSY